MGMFSPRSLLISCTKLDQDATLTHYSGYSEDDIQPVFKLMVDYLRRPVAHEAFFKKYASKKFLKGKSSHLLLPLIPC